MKKMALFSVIVTMAAGAAFAQFASGNYFGARGLFTLVPLELRTVNEPADSRNKDNDMTAAVGQYWGGAFGRIELKWRGQNSSMGYEGTLLTDTGTVRIDAANVWLKPLSWMKLTIGQFADDKLRGNFVEGNELPNFVLNTGSADFGADDVIFHLFHGGDSNNPQKWGGAMLTLTPINNLYVGVVLPAGLGGIVTNATEQSAGGETAKSIYSRVQAGVGYWIDNVGIARVQYVGKPEDNMNLAGLMAIWEKGDPYKPTNYKNDATSRVEAAFCFNGVNNMVLDVGVKYFLPKTEELTYLGKPLDLVYNPGIVFGLGWRLRVDNFAVTLLGAGHLLDGYIYDNVDVKNEFSHGMNLNFHLIPSYNLGFGFVGLNLGMDMTAKDTLNGKEIEGTGQTNYGGGVWFRKYMGADCFVLTGFTYTYLGVPGGGKRPPNSVTGYFRIPIIVEVNFQ
ncbi:MAG: hypothetical protein LBB72_03340 [Spirochaetaceae bacterium]|nr:hypothetical protein [Spirochaetaceae bacterium]